MKSSVILAISTFAAASVAQSLSDLPSCGVSLSFFTCAIFYIVAINQLQLVQLGRAAIERSMANLFLLNSKHASTTCSAWLHLLVAPQLMLPASAAT
jgi:hypothetical protein